MKASFTNDDHKNNDDDSQNVSKTISGKTKQKITESNNNNVFPFWLNPQTIPKRCERIILQHQSIESSDQWTTTTTKTTRSTLPTPFSLLKKSRDTPLQGTTLRFHNSSQEIIPITSTMELSNITPFQRDASDIIFKSNMTNSSFTATKNASTSMHRAKQEQPKPTRNDNNDYHDEVPVQKQDDSGMLILSSNFDDLTYTEVNLISDMASILSDMKKNATNNNNNENDESFSPPRKRKRQSKAKGDGENFEDDQDTYVPDLDLTVPKSHSSSSPRSTSPSPSLSSAGSSSCASSSPDSIVGTPEIKVEKEKTTKSVTVSPTKSQSSVTDSSNGKEAVQKPLRLSTKEDAQNLNSAQCFVRSHLLEIFTSQGVSSSTINTGTDSKSSPVPANRAGLRCSFCAHVVPSKRQKGTGTASFYPKNLAEIYIKVGCWQRNHLNDCKHIPKSIKNKYKKLKRDDRTHGRKQFWEDSARDVGLENSDAKKNDGITLLVGPNNNNILERDSVSSLSDSESL